jgi:glycerate kinase
MARIVPFVAGLALLASQPIVAMASPAQVPPAAPAGGGAGGGIGLGTIALALAGLSAIIATVVIVSHHNNTPVSP